MATVGEEIVQVLIDRDGYEKDEAEERVEAFIKDVRDELAAGAGFFHVQGMVRREFGLEPDYADAIFCALA